MTQDVHPIQHITIGLDNSNASMAALRGAVELAARLHAELTGWYVEDITLLRLAELPVARELSFFSPTLRRMAANDLEIQFRTQARRVQNQLSRLCERHGVPCRFRVTRGKVASELLNTEHETDLMILGKLGRSFPSRRKTGSITRLVISQRPGMTLVFQEHTPLTRPAILLYDGSAEADKAIAAAGHLQSLRQGKLAVILPADTNEEAGRLKDRIKDHPALQDVETDFRRISPDGISRIASQIAMAGSGPVILPCSPANMQTDQLCQLVEKITNPVLVVR